MKQLFATLFLLVGVCACERKEPDKPTVEESRKIDATIKVDAPHRDFPSFDAWSKVSFGLTEEQVIEILGKPKSGSPWADYKAFPDSENVQYQWSYGSLYPESVSHPFSSDFDDVSKGIRGSPRCTIRRSNDHSIWNTHSAKAFHSTRQYGI